MVSILVTVPETDECTLAETNPAALPISVPTFTLSPLATTASAGAPMCCPSGMTTLAVGAIASIGRPADNLFPEG